MVYWQLKFDWRAKRRMIMNKQTLSNWGKKCPQMSRRLEIGICRTPSAREGSLLCFCAFRVVLPWREIIKLLCWQSSARHENSVKQDARPDPFLTTKFGICPASLLHKKFCTSGSYKLCPNIYRKGRTPKLLLSFDHPTDSSWAFECDVVRWVHER